MVLSTTTNFDSFPTNLIRLRGFNEGCIFPCYLLACLIMDSDENNFTDENEDEETTKELGSLMKDYGLDRDEAKKVKEIMEEHGLDADDAVELKDIM